MTTNSDILLSVEDLKVYFRSEDEVARAVDGISFNVRREETVCLVGESGCGKTVTALSILGLIPRPPGEIAGGRILFNARNLLDSTEEQLQKIRGNHIAMVFQEPLTSLNPVFTVGDQIKEAIRIHENTAANQLEARCVDLLQSVGIPSPQDRINDYPHQLSGGQRQRVMIAMALACNPDLVIADEPTTALDVTVQAQILKLFAKLQKTLSMSVLYITHDLGVVTKVADRVCVMYAGIIVEQGAKSAIFDNSRHPYTQALAVQNGAKGFSASPAVYRIRPTNRTAARSTPAVPRPLHNAGNNFQRCATTVTVIWQGVRWCMKGNHNIVSDSMSLN